MNENELEHALTIFFQSHPSNRYSVKEVISGVSLPGADKSQVNRVLYALLRKRVLTKEGETPPLWSLNPSASASSSSSSASTSSKNKRSVENNNPVDTPHDFSTEEPKMAKKSKPDTPNHRTDLKNTNSSTGSPSTISSTTPLVVGNTTTGSSASSSTTPSNDVHHQLICVDLESSGPVLPILKQYITAVNNTLTNAASRVSTTSLSSSSTTPITSSSTIKPKIIGFCTKDYSTTSSNTSPSDSVSTIISQILPACTNHTNASNVLMGMTLGGLLATGKLNKYSSVYIVSNDSNIQENVVHELFSQLRSIRSDIIIQYIPVVPETIKNVLGKYTKWEE